jgi:hypothetical protein
MERKEFMWSLLSSLEKLEPRTEVINITKVPDRTWKLFRVDLMTTPINSIIEII